MADDDAEQMDWEHESGGNDPAAVEEFRDWGFGLFIHFGLAAELGAAMSWPIDGAEEGFADRYYDLADSFDPAETDPSRWATLARLAGMRYVVFGTKHHDGFCLFDSEHTTFDVSNAPYGADIAAEVARAVHEEGLGLGWYYSPPDMRYQRETGRDLSVHGVGPETAFEEWTEPFGPQDETFREYELGHVEELVTRYGDVDVLFFDGYCEPLKERAWEIDPEVVVTRGEMDTPELTVEGVPEDPPAGAWEACATTQRRAWGHKPTYPGNEFHEWKPAGELLDTLIETRAKGGNLLLNVGPTAEGEFPGEAVDRLRNLAYWNAVCGDAIHGVRPWEVVGEERGGPGTDPGRIWYTRERGTDTVYALFRPGWEDPGPDPIGVSLTGVRPGGDTTVRLLGQPDEADWSEDDDGLTVTLEHRGQPLFEWYWPRYDWPVAVEITNARAPGDAR